MDEQTALLRLRRGDLQSLEVLVERYQLRAVRVAYLILQDQQLAEGVAQTAFLKLPQRIRRFDSARPFAPWFMRCVVNDAVKAATRQPQWISLDAEIGNIPLLDIVPDPASGPEAQVAAADLEQDVREVLMRLSPQHRAVIVMRYYLDMSEEEMSQQANVAVGTIKSRLNRARKQLLGWLEASQLSTD